ncbi:hypothetical protein [Chitinophaga qingshengii]|uniref:Uncharacterized protein n=1 Tax=Chitinophaga qingshengii TaxID=1569794 RepID=A0ABR7TTT0_9BACT|nr:hypothetical protein [Chitinophaga qingshengii]MBC9933423.1 hypothetical protein [Chitinophaga qingshengii]
METGKEAIVQQYFGEPHKQWRVADLEQRLVAGGCSREEAAQQAVLAYDGYFSRQMKKKGTKVLIFLVCAVLFLARILMMADKMGNVKELSVFLALTAYTLVQGLIWSIQLFQLKEEISSFRDLRKL